MVFVCPVEQNAFFYPPHPTPTFFPLNTDLMPFFSSCLLCSLGISLVFYSFFLNFLLLTILSPLSLSVTVTANFFGWSFLLADASVVVIFLCCGSLTSGHCLLLQISLVAFWVCDLGSKKKGQKIYVEGKAKVIVSRLYCCHRLNFDPETKKKKKTEGCYPLYRPWVSQALMAHLLQLQLVILGRCRLAPEHRRKAKHWLGVQERQTKVVIL